MYLLEIDSAHNRLHITLIAEFSESDAVALHQELSERIPELKDNFKVLCDLSPIEGFAPAARPHYRSVMELCSSSGARKVIRIIPEATDNFGLTIMSNIHYDSKTPIINCTTLKEAFLHL